MTISSPRALRASLVAVLGLTLAGVGYTAIASEAATVPPPSGSAHEVTTPEAGASAQAPRALLGHVSAPGVVEPSSRVVELRSQVQGRLATVVVESGDAVTKGQLLAELENGVEQAQVALREAELAAARAALARAEAGARCEERRRAAADLARTEAEAGRARSELARVEALAKQKISTEHALDIARAALQAAEAARAGAAALVDELQAGERPEVLAQARAEVGRAEAALSLARAQLERTRITSPLDGRCVYRYREPGEVVGIPMEGPPLLAVAGGALRVRADVDARDIGRVGVGQRVTCTAPAFAGRELTGKVVLLESTLGRKNFRTDRPRERIDTKVLEVVCELDAGELPLGLEVTVTFLAD